MRCYAGGIKQHTALTLCLVSRRTCLLRFSRRLVWKGWAPPPEDAWGDWDRTCHGGSPSSSRLAPLALLAGLLLWVRFLVVEVRFFWNHWNFWNTFQSLDLLFVQGVIFSLHFDQQSDPAYWLETKNTFTWPDSTLLYLYNPQWWFFFS